MPAAALYLECLPRAFALLGGGGVQGQAGVGSRRSIRWGRRRVSSSIAIGERFSSARCAILA